LTGDFRSRQASLCQPQFVISADHVRFDLAKASRIGGIVALYDDQKMLYYSNLHLTCHSQAA
jgi:hypothetical protein